ncbi:glycosyl transferase [Tersicoccus sp. Bi-70]|uniref:glycosyl transferase n=1 Tax=Tersicoccus sp. Bi-70 TaxID=1897634 RepID=UPI0009787B2E|nr:glycosyl transferase [Tersicoccus sp. Bi-70]OMH31604.1 glycosyl transferase [Tersicoccus sp. Bi-70]
MPEPVRVLASFPRPRPTTNPYIVMLAQALERTPGLELHYFSYRTALLGRYDVFHAHWPEILVDGHGPVKTAARQALFALLLGRFAITRTPVVRTVHNLALPEGLSPVQRILLLAFDHLTTHRIRLNTSTELPPGQTVSTIPHGHYRDWFAAHPGPAPVPGRFGYAGLIRRYKGTETLVQAFRDLDGEAWSLVVGGRPSSPELAGTLTEAAAQDPRISTRLAFLTDAELVDVVGSSQLVVLPYRHMHNSGGALTALSLNRPVLVPDNTVNRRLADEVGAPWVQLFDGELTAADLQRASSAVQGLGAGDRPDLTGRDWSGAGQAHLAAFREAIGLRSGGTRRTGSRRRR